jgi:SpoVK/Ycf46/Vps4 family AAA+-type ATPase
VPLPDEAGRRAILEVHLRGVPLEGAADAAAAAAAAAEPGAAGPAGANGAGGAPPVVEGVRVLTAGEAAARLAAVTPGFNGAELANVINEASLLTARAGKTEVRAARGVQRGAGRGGGCARPSALCFRARRGSFWEALSNQSSIPQVGMLELLEGVRRQRFGVDGGGSGAGVGAGPLPELRRRLGTWLVEAAGGRPVKVASA